jgi:hypothetical protein
MTRRVSPLALLVALAAGGCGPTYHPVSGVVKLDGSPVAGATVTLISDDGLKSYSGFTDAAGAFTVSGDKPGALAGNYKVTVTKVTPVAGAEGMSPGNPEYMKLMMKEHKEAGGGKAGAMPGMATMSPAGKAAGPKTELPVAYATPQSTPLTAKVPVEGGQLVLELKK